MRIRNRLSTITGHLIIVLSVIKLFVSGEIVLGFFVLGIYSYLIFSDWQQLNERQRATDDFLTRVAQLGEATTPEDLEQIVLLFTEVYVNLTAEQSANFHVVVSRAFDRIHRYKDFQHTICCGCQYLHGKDGIVCAVHPCGPTDNACNDHLPHN